MFVVLWPWPLLWPLAMAVAAEVLLPLLPLPPLPPMMVVVILVIVVIVHL